MTTVDGLEAARTLIATPERWTTGAFARDASGMSTSLYDDGAVCFCAAGGILAVAGQHRDAALAALINVVGWPISDYNDRHTHADVLEAYARAIFAERAKLAATETPRS